MRILAGFLGLMSFVCGTTMLFLAIDIVDGRRMGMKVSPYVGADTTDAALLLAVVMMLAAFVAGLLLFSATSRSDSVAS